MKNNTKTTNAPINENYAELRKKALEYGIYDPSFEYRELRDKVYSFENNILRVTGSLFTGEMLSDEEVNALNVDQKKSMRIIKTLGDSLSYAIQLYADSVNNIDLVNQEPMSLGYEILKEIKDCYYDKLSWKTRPKRITWECLQVNINNIDQNGVFDSSKAVNIKEFSNKKEAAASGKPVLVPITETRAKKIAIENDRELLVVKMVPSDGPFADVVLSEAMKYVHDANQLEALMEEKRRDIITNGITDSATGKHYLVAVRSAAQSRNGSMWFYEAHDFTEVDEFRRRCCCLTKVQWEKEFGNKVFMSKMEARIGLSVSSVLDIREVTKACREENFIKTIENFNVKLIDDVKNDIVLNTIQPIFNPKGEFEGCMTAPTATKITNNASDGCGMISVEATIQCNYALNLISDKEYRRAMNLFEEYGRSLTTFKKFEPADPSSKEAKDYYWFESFILKLHKVLQFRHAGDKGILVMADFDHYGIKEDILIHESVRKYDFGNWADAPLEICNYDKKKTGKANMNFQFWNALTIPNEDMKSIVDESLEYVSHGVLEKPEMAMKFLGMLSKIGEDEDDIDTVIKLNTTLKTDPSMLDDKQVQKWLSQKVEKFLNDLQIGRIPIDGAYYFIVTDPRYLIANYLKRDDINFLGSKQNYLNGFVGDVAAFRAPLIDKSEARKLPCVADDELWFYTDLLILNPFDGTASAAGGACL